MSNSILLYHCRDGTLHVIDPDAIPHTDDLKPINYIVAALEDAGYEGVKIDGKLLTNGRYVRAVSVNSSTPEGRLISELNMMPDDELPTPQSVVDKIRWMYENEHS